MPARGCAAGAQVKSSGAVNGDCALSACGHRGTLASSSTKACARVSAQNLNALNLDLTPQVRKREAALDATAEAWDAARGRGLGISLNPGEGAAGAGARAAQGVVAAAAALAAAGTEAEQARRCAWLVT